MLVLTTFVTRAPAPASPVSISPPTTIFPWIEFSPVFAVVMTTFFTLAPFLILTIAAPSPSRQSQRSTRLVLTVFDTSAPAKASPVSISPPTTTLPWIEFPPVFAVVMTTFLTLAQFLILTNKKPPSPSNANAGSAAESITPAAAAVIAIFLKFIFFTSPRFRVFNKLCRNSNSAARIIYKSAYEPESTAKPTKKPNDYKKRVRFQQQTIINSLLSRLRGGPV